MIRSMFLAAAAVCVLASCGGGGSPVDSLAGPCDVEVVDPAVTVVAATSSRDGSAITTLRFSEATVSGIRLPFEINGQTNNLVVTDGVATCTVPCSFGNAEAPYTFRVDADGFTVKTVSVDVKFKTRSGVCPLLLQGGARVTIELDPDA